MEHTIVNCAQKETIAKIETSLQFIIQDRAEMKEFIADKMTGLHAEYMSQYDLLVERMKSFHDVEMEQFKRVTDRQDIANGRTTKIEDRLDRRAIEIEEMKSKGRQIINNQKFWTWITENPIKSIAIFFLVVWGVVTLTAYVDIKTIIALMK